MTFSDIFSSEDFFLMEGAMYDACVRSSPKAIDPHIAYGSMPIEAPDSLEKLYKRYIDIAEKNKLPIFTLTTTFRANSERVGKSKFRTKNVNQAAIDFLCKLRSKYARFSSKIFIGATLGPKGDCYQPNEAPSFVEALEFHKYQIQKFSRSKADFIFASTLPDSIEAKAIAMLSGESKLPYFLSFVINSEGKILDGVSLAETINEIDSQSTRAPLGYFINCVHPELMSDDLIELLSKPMIMSRVVGFQGNTSKKPAEQLNDLNELETMDPMLYGKSVSNILSKFRLKVVGGCCGTDERHIKYLAAELAAKGLR